MCLINLQQLYSSKIIQWPNNILIHDSGKVIVRKGVMKMEVLDWGVGSPSRCNALSRFTNGPGRSNLPWISQTSSHHWCYDDEGEICKRVEFHWLLLMENKCLVTSTISHMKNLWSSVQRDLDCMIATRRSGVFVGSYVLSPGALLESCSCPQSPSSYHPFLFHLDQPLFILSSFYLFLQIFWHTDKKVNKKICQR